ncbi:MAG: phosphotransferase [Oscillospiraceae bacterium]|jgi:Ser/Thr protein kinase RdoA (MazF antagonist)|nr:phosphotransferase [Oscillospiraceae bacterium]
MKMIQDLLWHHYGIIAETVQKLAIGAGSDTYVIHAGEHRFILKNANANEANHPENEPTLCDFLRSKGIPTSEFVKNLHGEYVTRFHGKDYLLQKYIPGETPPWNTASDVLLTQCAQMLGRIHKALEHYPALPVGIGEGFFTFMTPNRAQESYRKSLETARVLGRSDIMRGIAYRIGLMERLFVPPIDISRLTCLNTHGDYFISNLICAGDEISGVIDWTTACVHPAVWEIARSYIYAAPECAGGVINEERFLIYVRDYLQHASLNDYDLAMLPWIFYYQICVCDYYGQYFASQADNREIYLQQAVLSTRLMPYFESNAEKLSQRLANGLA